MDEIPKSCDHIHECGHLCRGSAGEKVHLPCLEEECIEVYNQKHANNRQLQLLDG